MLRGAASHSSTSEAGLCPAVIGLPRGQSSASYGGEDVGQIGWGQAITSSPVGAFHLSLSISLGGRQKRPREGK